MQTKQQIIAVVLDRRLREEARRKGGTPVVATRAIVDRFEFTAESLQTEQIHGIAGFNSIRPHLIRQKSEWSAYPNIRQFESLDGKTTVAVLSHPRKPWLDPFRVEVIPDDATGLLPRHVLPFWKLTSGQKLRVVEWAVDFPPATHVGGACVRRCALFGKSRPGEEAYFNRDTWGTRKSGKFVRSYFKYEIEAHRVEIRLGNRFLQAHGIQALSDLWKLGDILPGAHIRFVRIKDDRVAKRLRNSGKENEIPATLERLSELKPRLHDALTYLRAQGLANAHRFLVPLKTNRLVRDAARKFLKEWNWA